MTHQEQRETRRDAGPGTQPGTRRERKKRQTRQLLVETAIRLFLEQGYEQTTIAQITAEADVAKKTFFNHFPTKEDILFADIERYHLAIAEVVANRAPDEPIPDLLLKIYEQVFSRRLTESSLPQNDDVLELSRTLVATVPAIQAKTLQIMVDLQYTVAEALTKAYPDELDLITASAAVGAMMGAAQAASLASLRQGHTMEQYLESTRRAIDLAMQGVRAL